MSDTIPVPDWPTFVAELHDVELGKLVASVHAEQHQRALAAGDPDAFMEEAIQTSFDRRGLAEMPYLHNDVLLVCPGAIVARSAATHECRFVVVDDHWVWDHPDKISDRMDDVGGHSKKSITLLPALADATVTAVHSKKTAEGHRRIAADTFKIVDGKLIESTRTVHVPDQHR